MYTIPEIIDNLTTIEKKLFDERLWSYKSLIKCSKLITSLNKDFLAISLQAEQKETKFLTEPLLEDKSQGNSSVNSFKMLSIRINRLLSIFEQIDANLTRNKLIKLSEKQQSLARNNGVSSIHIEVVDEVTETKALSSSSTTLVTISYYEDKEEPTREFAVTYERFTECKDVVFNQEDGPLPEVLKFLSFPEQLYLRRVSKNWDKVIGTMEANQGAISLPLKLKDLKGVCFINPQAFEFKESDSNFRVADLKVDAKSNENINAFVRSINETLFSRDQAQPLEREMMEQVTEHARASCGAYSCLANAFYVLFMIVDLTLSILDVTLDNPPTSPETLWILYGIFAGGYLLTHPNTLSYLNDCTSTFFGRRAANQVAPQLQAFGSSQHRLHEQNIEAENQNEGDLENGYIHLPAHPGP